MDHVTLLKDDLLSKVVKNREVHDAMLKVAILGYRKKVTETLKRMLKQAENGEDVETHSFFSLRKPESHLKEYDRVISMLERHTKGEIEITNKDFGRYYEDDWDWKENWIHSNSIYSGGIRDE